ncbi:MAG: DUF2637 domain-containing protein [Ardenticatenaceae bacterium]|nr:DUF2637 domain-containing protein [Ardenticatenaceae bacterium]
MQRINHLISLVSALLVLFLAGSAFFLSFESLKDLAVQIGIAEAIAWLYPAIIDGAIIVFSLSVLRANLTRERPVYPWVLVSLFTLLSVVLNIIHAQRELLAQFLAAIPPVALFLSFELLLTVANVWLVYHQPGDGDVAGAIVIGDMLSIDGGYGRSIPHRTQG